MKLKTFKITTFGCRVNQAESRALGEQIVKLLNCQIVNNYSEADLVIINTCCVTNKAEKEVRKEIRRVKKENPNCFLVVAGCWAEKTRLAQGRNLTRFSKSRSNCFKPFHIVKGETLFCENTLKFVPFARKHNSLFSLIDLLVTNEEKNKIAEILKKEISINQPRPRVNYKKFRFEDKYAKHKKTLIKIQEGCDKFCSYCIVPYVRGRSKSRSADEIVKEINKKVKEGIGEVVLTGIDIGSYKLKTHPPVGGLKYKNDLVKLIKLILAKTKVEKISFGSMGWEVFDDGFIKLYEFSLLGSGTKFDPVFESRAKRTKETPSASGRDAINTKTLSNLSLSPANSLINNRLSTHFHIPLQSGCNKTLKRMRRSYTVEEFIDKIKELKQSIPGPALNRTCSGSGFSFSTDIIVGFPGETDKEFKQTLKTIRELKKILGKNFTHAHIFRYSEREGTLAEKMEKQGKWKKVDEKVKKKRARKIKLLISNY